MNPLVTLTLERAQLLRLPRPDGVCLSVRRGALWITRDGRRNDLTVRAGQQVCLDAGPAALISTVGGPAEFSARTPAPQVLSLA